MEFSKNKVCNMIPTCAEDIVIEDLWLR